MWRNDLKTAFRTLLKNKAYSCITILGLTLGICACMLTITRVIDDLSYDKFWSRSPDLYKANVSSKVTDGVFDRQSRVPLGLGWELKERFPEVESYALIWSTDLRLKIENDQPDGISVRSILADSTAKHMLDFKALSGLEIPFIVGQDNMLITESFRDKYFKGENPIGKIMYDVPSWQQDAQPYLITGVIRDIPENTHLRADVVILRKPNIEKLSKDGSSSLGDLYFMLKPGTDIQSFTQKVNRWYKTFMDIGEEEETLFDFQSIKDIYLQSEFNTRLQVKSTLQTVYISGGIGLLLLLIACINFINLSIARAVKRLKETGIRKILGASRKQVMRLFLTESLLFFAIATSFACVLYTLSIPPLETFLGHRLTHTLTSGLPIFSITIFLVFMISVFTGAYPALVMSRFKVANSLKGRFTNSSLFSGNSIRKALVVIQFSIVITVLIALLVVYAQLRYMGNKDLGYNKDQLLHVGLRSWDGKGEAFKAELRKLSGVQGVSLSGWDPYTGKTSMSQTFDHPNKENEKLTANFIFADFDFVQTLEMDLLQGRILESQYGNDLYSMDSQSVLMTASTAKMLGIHALNEKMTNIGYTPVGILKDFHNESLHNALGPIFIMAEKSLDYAYMFIRVTAGQEGEVLPEISKIWRQFYPDKLLDAAWVSDILQKQYEVEQKQQTLFVLFSNLMLFLSSLGVLGLIMHAAEQRVKEIGIRKVLGASVIRIVKLLSQDYIKLVCIAILIASSIAWLLMNKWLDDYAYRITIQWWMFVFSAVLVMLIVLLTISIQTIKAAIANPVDSLRDE